MTATLENDGPNQLFFDFAGASAAPAMPPAARLPRTTASNTGTLPASAAAFMTESRAAQLFMKVAAEFREGQIKQVSVRFHPFRATLYSYKISLGFAKVKLHVVFRKASEPILTQAAQVMLSRRRHRRVFDRCEYDAFVRAIPESDFELPGARRGRTLAVKGPGVHRSLEESFQRVNKDYFHEQLPQPELCWSPVRARRLLGSYHSRKDRVIISRVFDSLKVPLYVLDYLMFHELLHKFLGIGTRDDGKRCVHGAEFRKLESQFCFFKEAQQFLKTL